MMYTVKDIDAVFRNIASEHKQLKAYYTNSQSEIDINKISVNQYPLLFSNCTGVSVSQGVSVYSWEVVVADLVIEPQTETIVNVYEETYLIYQDIIALFELDQSNVFPNAGNQAWGIDTPIRMTPFTSQYDNLLTGWSATFEIQVPNALNLCVALF